MVVGLAVMTACSLFTDLDNLGGDPPTNDGGEGDGGGGSVDSSTSGPADAGDGGNAVEEAGDGRRFCTTLTTQPLLCEDFEDPTTVGWTTRLFETASKLEVRNEDGGGTTEANRRALYSAPTGSIDTVRFAFLERGFLQPNTKARLSYSLSIIEAPPVGGYEVNILRFRAQNGTTSDLYISVDIAGGAAGLTLYEQAFYSDGGGGGRLVVPRVPVNLNTWHRLSIEVDLTNAKLKFILNGTTVDFDLKLVNTPGSPTVTAGITYVGKGSNTGKVLIDNLVFEVLP
jgi:hypothetical protein